MSQSFSMFGSPEPGMGLGLGDWFLPKLPELPDLPDYTVPLVPPSGQPKKKTMMDWLIESQGGDRGHNVSRDDQSMALVSSFLDAGSEQAYRAGLTGNWQSALGNMLSQGRKGYEARLTAEEAKNAAEAAAAMEREKDQAQLAHYRGQESREQQSHQAALDQAKRLEASMASTRATLKAMGSSQEILTNFDMFTGAGDFQNAMKVVAQAAANSPAEQARELQRKIEEAKAIASGAREIAQGDASLGYGPIAEARRAEAQLGISRQNAETSRLNAERERDGSRLGEENDTVRRIRDLQLEYLEEGAKRRDGDPRGRVTESTAHSRARVAVLGQIPESLAAITSLSEREKAWQLREMGVPWSVIERDLKQRKGR